MGLAKWIIDDPIFVSVSSEGVQHVYSWDKEIYFF